MESLRIPTGSLHSTTTTFATGCHFTRTAQHRAEGSVVRGIYDLVFAYRDGQANRPSFAAGQALRGSFRMFFGYRGSFAYRMQAGMGDTVFAPYYEVLRTRGVKFEFFHRVTDLRQLGWARSVIVAGFQRGQAGEATTSARQALRRCADR